MRASPIHYGRIVPAVLLAWFAGVAAVTFAIEPTREVIVLSPAASIGSIVTRAPVRVLDVPNGFARVRGSEAGFVRELYAAGAWVVLPAITGGCRGVARLWTGPPTSNSPSPPSRG